MPISRLIPNRVRSASRSNSAASCKHSSRDFASFFIDSVLRDALDVGMAISSIAQPCSGNTDRKAHLIQDQPGLLR